MQALCFQAGANSIHGVRKVMLTKYVRILIWRMMKIYLKIWELRCLNMMRLIVVLHGCQPAMA